MKKIWVALAGASLAAFAATAAQATIFTFDIKYWEGGASTPPADIPYDRTAHFTVDDAWGGESGNGFWSYADGHIFDFPLFDGESSHANIDFYYDWAYGGLTLVPFINTPDGLDVDFSYELDPIGPALFTDDDNGNHHLQVGTYTLLWWGGEPSDGQFLVTISSDAEGAVPELATWAMMVGGFGAVGATMRRRRRTSVRFG
ncbi:MAG TPA: PEPxxWA-CTERM sorting domain-containing protein [Sphingomonas sp.]|uniref:PEPxxWA-CTERM sorting domain-containing protein n=1 Tax=Sphingomonas sp. TaxID=28214 RepID=UPI002BD85586|nr:PEPxxWA-CTERM sorting domain-containing protein [Sphingomonas sp.]HMI18188.1 PEPxxWA-CTERM sorting domain-containing protein [Sphingomonas sp.]